CAHDVLQAIADDGLEGDLDPEFVELLSEIQRVRVLAEGCQQLRTDRYDLGYHDASLNDEPQRTRSLTPSSSCCFVSFVVKVFLGRIEQILTLHIPGEMMHGVGGGKNRRSPRRKGKSDEPGPSHGQRSLAVWRDFYHATFARKRSCDIKIPFAVERE